MASRLSQVFSALRPSPVDSIPGNGTHYLFKASLAGGAREFQLLDSGLSWQGQRSNLWPFETIAAIRLSYRPASMQSYRFRADIMNKSGQSATLYSTTWHSLAQMARQDNDYRAFIVELHRRVAAANPAAQLVAGINPLLYALGFAALVLIAGSLVVLFARAIWIGEWAGALFIAGFAAWFIWQIGGFMRRNRPRTYTFDALPQDLLP